MSTKAPNSGKVLVVDGETESWLEPIKNRSYGFCAHRIAFCAHGVKVSAVGLPYPAPRPGWVVTIVNPSRHPRRPVFQLPAQTVWSHSPPSSLEGAILELTP